ncbi:MAG: hypothetical protein AAF585_12815 [Verrucomicrobiota bacterium]
MEFKRIRLVRRIIASMLALSAAFIGGWTWWSINQTPWRSPPDQVRPDARLLSALTEKSSLNPATPVFEDTRVEPAENNRRNRLRWWYRRKARNDTLSFIHPVNCEIVWANGDGVAQLPNDAGEIRMKAVAFAYRGDWEFDSERKDWSPVSHPVYVNPLTHKQLENPPTPGGIQFDSSLNRPGVRWVFDVDCPDTEFQVVRSEPWVFDARTETHLSPGQAFYRNREIQSQIVIDSFLNLWHDTDLALVIDVALGPPVEFHIPNQPNWQTTMDGFRIQYLTTVTGKLAEHRQSRSDPDLVSLETETEFDPNTASALFRFEPPAFGKLVTISAKTNETRSRFERLTRFDDDRLFRSEPYEMAAEEVTSLRGRYLPNIARVVFVLPGIPGIQNSREEINNLFKVMIPELRVESQSELRDIIEKSTQMTMTGSFGSEFTPGYFPHTFENVTPQQLLAEWENQTVGPEITTRSQDFLIVRDAKLEWREQLKQWWRERWK